MSSLPTDRLSNLRNKIHQNASQVHANKTQCERLCERIDQLIEPLERLEHTSSLILREETRPILDKFLQCIDDCNEYIEKLKSSEQWYEEVYEYKKSEDKFFELNERLSQLGQDLCLGINIQQLFNRQQDKQDQQEDLHDLKKKSDEISQKMLEKQCDQYQLINKMIDKRFQSFRFYLAQNLLMQEDSYQSRELIHEHQQILHIPYKDFDIEHNPIGNGGFADVYKAVWLTHHDQVAIKIIRINHLSRNVRTDFYREISTMYRIRYENVLTVLGACIEPNFYAIIAEYMPLGSLYDILHKKHEQITFDWSDRYSLAWQMAKSINYLHNLNPIILHRDIKSMNFLLKYNGLPNQKYLVKVCDFGLAEIRRETLSQSSSFPSSQLVGSFYWKAPELLTSRSRHTKQTDVYSLGIVFWELATERKPWDEYEDEAIIVIQVKTGERPTIPSDIPEPYKQLIQLAWNQEPQKRPTCFQLMEQCYKQINQTYQSTLSNSNTLENAIDIHSLESIIEEDELFNSTTTLDSTRIGIQVGEEDGYEPKVDQQENEEQSVLEEEKSMDSVPDIIITEPSSPDTTTEISFTDDQADLKQTETNEIEHSASSSSLNDSEQQNQTSSPQLEPTLTKSVENLPTISKPDNDIQNPINQFYTPPYKLEKRRSLHDRAVWTTKKN